jgi:hypothetical protein
MKIARGRDWFRSSICVLFGDAAGAVFPLGRLVLLMTIGRPMAGNESEEATGSYESPAYP